MDKQENNRLALALFGEVVKRTRLKNRMSQQELADHAKISTRVICGIENAKRQEFPTVDVVCRLANALGIHVLDLFPMMKEKQDLSGDWNTKLGDEQVLYQLLEYYYLSDKVNYLKKLAMELAGSALMGRYRGRKKAIETELVRQTTFNNLMSLESISESEIQDIDIDLSDLLAGLDEGEPDDIFALN